MRAAPRLAAAMDILDRWLTSGAPLERLLADWGRDHRFAGVRDRAAIGDHVYTALRRRARAAALMGAQTGRALVLGSLHLDAGLSAAAIKVLLDEGGPHGPAGLTPEEAKRLTQGLSADLPPHVLGEYPAWLAPRLEASLGRALAAEAAAWTARAPLDLRVNMLKASRDAVAAALVAEGIACMPTPYAPAGLRTRPGAPVQRTRAYREGLVEIQDEGSQLAVQFARAEPGMTVLDIAAGAGGKTLALAAALAGQGRLIAIDSEPARLARMAPRLSRAGVTGVETRVLDMSAADPALRATLGEADLVFLDAPCSGTGTWRRHPDAKWRLAPHHLERLRPLQERLLAAAGRHVKPGGRLVYVTCSLLAEENEAPIAAFLATHPGFRAEPPRDALAKAGLAAMSFAAGTVGVRITPATTGTDGFFFCALTSMR